mgnify:CR=1 FL=1
MGFDSLLNLLFLLYIGIFRWLFQQHRGISGDSLLNEILAESSEKNDRGVGYVENCQEHAQIQG